MNAAVSSLTTHYANYRSALALIPRCGEFADYDWFKSLPQLNGSGIIYDQMLREYAPEMANSINQLINCERRLGAWDAVMSALSLEDAHDVLMEFVDPLAVLGLSLPYVIRARIIFATAHLSHQANRVPHGEDWKDDLPQDSKIDLKIADQYSASWKTYRLLEIALHKLGSSGAYESEVGNFRNKYQHRYPPRVHLGVTGLMTRVVDPNSRKVCYVIAETAPLDISRIRSFLASQIVRCRASFEAFKVLVREHTNALTKFSTSVQNDR